MYKVGKTVFKTICIMADFSINLLNYESHNNTNEFIKSMVSHHLLPHILQPTRATDHSATIIDNIFTNATEYDTISVSVAHKDDYSNLIKINFYQTFLRSAGMRTKIFLLMLTQNFPYFIKK